VDYVNIPANSVGLRQVVKENSVPILLNQGAQ